MFVVESLENERHSFRVGTNAGSVLYQPLILNFLFYFLLVQRFYWQHPDSHHLCQACGQRPQWDPCLVRMRAHDREHWPSFCTAFSQSCCKCITMHRAFLSLGSSILIYLDLYKSCCYPSFRRYPVSVDSYFLEWEDRVISVTGINNCRSLKLILRVEVN